MTITEFDPDRPALNIPGHPVNPPPPTPSELRRAQERAAVLTMLMAVLLATLFLVTSCSNLFRQSEANRAPDACLSAGGHYETKGRVPYTSIECIGT